MSIIAVRQRHPSAVTFKTSCGHLGNRASGHGSYDAAAIHHSNAVIVLIHNIKIAVRADGKILGQFRLAATAKPPSPENPRMPLPATAVMMPLVSILRTRSFNVSAI